MPELPEVETIKNDLIRAGLIGHVIRGADIYWHRTLATPALAEFQKQIKGMRIEKLSRRGKYLIIELASCDLRFAAHEPSFLIIHLRMSGRIDLKEKNFEPRKHDRARLIFKDDSGFYFHDTRKFGRWWFVHNAEKVIGKLGIEPLDPEFTSAWLTEKIKNKSRALKPMLLDQMIIAGIGNIYADEALWYAKLHPQKNSAKLRTEEVKALHAGIVKAISLGIQNAGTSLGVGKANFYSAGGKRGTNQDQLNVFRRTGEPCPRCHEKIIRIIVSQRSTHLCPKCQKHP